MLLTLMILQILILQALNQTHQQVLAQLNAPLHRIPGVSASAFEQSAIKIPLFSEGERQFFSAQLEVCESKYCYLYKQVFSVSSAILKEEPQWHSLELVEQRIK